MHRDVSAGNIIIKPTDNGETIGHLIDFDHAKVTRKFAALKRYNETDEPLELYKAYLSRVQEMKAYTFEDDVIIKALHVIESHRLPEYVGQVVLTRQQFFDLSPSGKLMSADLHWDMVVSITCNILGDIAYNLDIQLFRTFSLSAHSSQITKPEAVVERCAIGPRTLEISSNQNNLPGNTSIHERRGVEHQIP